MMSLRINSMNNPKIVPSLAESVNDNRNHTTIINSGEHNHTHETNSNTINNLASSNQIGEDNTNLVKNSTLLSDGLFGSNSNHHPNQSQLPLLSSSNQTTNITQQLYMNNNRTMQNSTTNHGDGEVWYGMPKVDNFVDVFSLCCSTAVIFGGLIPYIPQYLKIKHSMSSDGFSTYGE